MANLHISISAEPIFNLGPITVTNSLLVSWLVTGLLCLLAFLAARSIKPTSKPKGLQAFLEALVESLYSLVSGITGELRAKEIFPYITTFFLFILLSNWSGLIPGVGTITLPKPHPVVTLRSPSLPEAEVTPSPAEYIPLLRAPTADLNTTFALALISVFLIQFTGLKHLGLKYLGKFFNLKSPIYFFIGILELIAEASKILSFAFRLFGNIFAGEVLLAVMAFLVPLIAPLPFLGLEIFVGLVQALVFSMLTLVFMNLATIVHEEEH